MPVKELIKNYIYKEMIPFIIESNLTEDAIVVIGGSYSYGYSDEKSDIDVYILLKSQIANFIRRFRPILFSHIEIEGYKVQIIPMDLSSPINKKLGSLIYNPAENIVDASIKEIHQFTNYIPIYDSCKRINTVKSHIENMKADYWKSHCRDLCCETIDVLESFYSSLRRCNIASIIKYGEAIKSLLQIIYLTDNKPYPPDKWLYIGLSDTYKEIFNGKAGGFLPKGTGILSLKESVDFTNEYVAGVLKDKNLVPDYIIKDMLNP